MRRYLPLVVGVTALAAAGCRDDARQGQDTRPRPPRQEATLIAAQSRTVLQFLENTALLDETFARCRNDPGGLGQTPDCRNAGHAKERLMMLGRDRAIQRLKR